MPRKRRPTIGPPHPRLVASFAMMPITVAVLPLMAWLCDPLVEELALSYEWAPLLVGVGAITLYYSGILFIWWRTFTWTTKSRKLLGAITVIMVFGLPLAIPILTFRPSELLVLALILAAAVGGGVMVTMISRACWSESDYGMGLSVPCPGCGTDLRGSRACHCPSCERDYSLEDLVESTRVADALGITRGPGEQPS